MSAEKVENIYPLAALLLHECGQDVTKEGMLEIFAHVKAECQPKLAELYSFDKERMESIYEMLTQAPVAASGVAVAESAAAKEEAKPKEEAASAAADDVDLFGDDDLFG
ncbi:hypothetical protein VCUG_01118 [Vavraia culicis subsp. floridensis]|uniref:60S acidic ribosomal protein P2 n=1 Tax=Vavraia culicis (isolate floridensis) TaxID=948595 RepID=L2GUP4_VAVCU|nr:uncharacterized protein VCUG_01118 [Vavraia culicis subsp. floridensis]ELA47349.1 hypothetical protein VCUG_01118 [Vavraia culicis subsp. floridensis]